jgi:hypothetical protein
VDGQAVCLRRRFERLEDGSYICSEFSSALWIRCIAHHDGYFEHVEGARELSIVTVSCRFRCLRVRTSAVRTRLRGPGRASRGFVDIPEGCDSYPSCGAQGRPTESFEVQTACLPDAAITVAKEAADGGDVASQSPRLNASWIDRTISTFSSDIAYSSSAAGRLRACLAISSWCCR